MSTQTANIHVPVSDQACDMVDVSSAISPGLYMAAAGSGPAAPRIDRIPADRTHIAPCKL